MAVPSARGVTADVLDRWLELALVNVQRTRPYMEAVLWQDDQPWSRPETRHPAFGSSFDWHSSVHMHWSLVRLLRLGAGVGSHGRQVALTLDAHLAPEAIASETEALRQGRLFERPYGWAWAVALHAEAIAATEELGAPASRWADALRPLRDLVVECFAEFLPRLPFPVRHGVHGNTAFALRLLHHAGQVVTDDDVIELAVHHARRLFLHDVDAPAHWEPSGEDFLSSALTEGQLLAVVLGPDFPDWWERFLPGTAELIASAIRESVATPDLEDGKLAHLAGLNLSRAWAWAEISTALPPRDPRRTAALDAADRHRAAGLSDVVSGAYAADHWLVSFGLLATTGL